MTVTVDRLELLNALEQARWAVAQKDIVPTYTHVFAEGGRLFAFNGESGIEAVCPSLGDLKFNTKAGLLMPLLKALSGEELKVVTKNDKLHLACGAHKSKLPMLDNYVPYPGGERPDDWQPVPTGFVEALTRAQAFASKSDTRPFLCAVYIQDGYFYGTTGDIACRCHVEGMPDFTALIAADSVNAMVNLGQPRAMAKEENTLWLDYGDTMLFTMLLDSTTWPVDGVDQRMDSASESCMYKPVGEDLEHALSRSLLFLTGNTILAVTMAAEPDGVVVTAGPDFREVLDLTLDTELELKANPEYLLRALEYAEEIGVAESDPYAPISFYGTTVEFTALVMPVME